ncbi:MAG TPA: hypothetical protein VFW05_10050, partial [Verrucomicrobiae bacterium]|nr:hypothetical protein [Verrucomicrobiae bacterium]
VFRARRSTPSGLGCAAARYARLRSASPQRGGGRWKKDNLQKDFYTPMNLNGRTNCLAAESIRLSEQWMHKLISVFAAFVSFCKKNFHKIPFDAVPHGYIIQS